MKKLLLAILLSTAASADFIDLLEQEIFVHVSTKLEQDKSIKSFKISDVSFIDMDRNAEYYIAAKWSQITKDSQTQNCQAEFFISDFNREDYLIQEQSKVCK